MFRTASLAPPLPTILLTFIPRKHLDRLRLAACTAALLRDCFFGHVIIFPIQSDVVYHDMQDMILSQEVRMGKIAISLPEDMHTALQKIATDEDRVISYLVRRAISEFLLKNYDIKVEHTMSWGGRRDTDGDSQE